MQALSKHGPRIAVTLLPLIFAVLHAVGVLQLGVLQRLDDIIYDARMRATLPATRDERVVIVDIDEKSLAEVGRWPQSLRLKRPASEATVAASSASCSVTETFVRPVVFSFAMLPLTLLWAAGDRRPILVVFPRLKSLVLHDFLFKKTLSP